MLRLMFLMSCLFVAGFGGDDPELDQYTKLRGDYAASHILVAHQMALRADKEITRNKPEALAKAKELLARIKADPSLFEELARKESDGSTAVTAGYLGVVGWGKFDPTFERAVKKLDEGELIDKPVLTEFGYHIIRREVMRVKNYAANLFVITYRGAVNVEGIPYRRANRKITKEEARTKIDDFSGRLTSDNFADMVEEHGDFRKLNGFFGNFQQYDSATSAILVEAFRNRSYGELTPVLELPFGYAVAQRVRVVKLAAARIVIKHRDVDKAPQWMTRTKEDAGLLANDLLTQLKEKPKQFAKLAKKYSEGLYKGSGGIQPIWLKGGRESRLEEALLATEIGAVYPEILDLEDGLTIIQRLDPDELEN